MSLRTVLGVVGVILGGVSLAQVPCLILAIWLGEPWEPFAQSMLAGVTAAGLLVLPARRRRLQLDHRSALVTVSMGWIAACAVGSLPLYLHPGLQLGVADAFFESTSGLTTTGATLLEGLDGMPRSLLLWRSLEHWIGGLGMVVLGIAVLPMLGLGGMQLFRTEAPGHVRDRLAPRVAETAKILWSLYLGLTAVAAALFWLAGMTPFDAINHAMSTLATGGFSTHDASLGRYESHAIYSITSVFMLVGGTSFLILHRGLTGQDVWRNNPQLRAYLGIITVAALLVSLDLRLNAPDEYATAADSMQHGLFQVVSIMTGTGFTTRDYTAWPTLSHAVLLLLCFVGGMAGSTTGGVKVVRVVLIAKLAGAQFFRLIHPRGVVSLTLGDRRVENDVVLGVIGFVGMWIFLLGLGTLALAGMGTDLFTAFAASTATLGNIGPGFEGVGPAHTYARFAAPAKLVLSFLMIVGRLEIFTVLVLLVPGLWRD